jgi:hypothetical protein
MSPARVLEIYLSSSKRVVHLSTAEPPYLLLS